jgi:hypothetical protein
MITDLAQPLLGMAHWAVIGFRRGVARGAAGERYRERNRVAGPSDSPSSITA